MADLIEGVGLVAGGGVGLKVVEFVIGKLWAKADKQEEALEVARREQEERDRKDREIRESKLGDKIDTLIRDVSDMKSAAQLDRERATATAASIQGAMAEVKARVEGMSNNYGTRLHGIETKLSVIEARSEDTEKRISDFERRRRR
jgi:chromosome segregation ATPase